MDDETFLINLYHCQGHETLVYKKGFPFGLQNKKERIGTEETYICLLIYIAFYSR
jgi:hypothetical protein